MDEIEEFCNYLTKSVNRRLLTLLSRVLEVPDDYLWDNVQSHGSPTGEGYFRHALFRPVGQQTREASKGLRMHGHTDFGLTTLLFSVPISCLQIWGRDEQWYYVPYKPGALVINIGDTLEIVSGGHFKATRHRVFSPPADQVKSERLSLVVFNSSVGDLRMEPAAGELMLAFFFPFSFTPWFSWFAFKAVAQIHILIFSLFLVDSLWSYSTRGLR